MVLLDGVNVILASRNRGLTIDMREALTRNGAKILFSQYNPEKLCNAQLLCSEVKASNTKISAVVIHLEEMEQSETREAILDIARKLRGQLPLIVMGSGDSITMATDIESCGAKYINYMNQSCDKIAYAICNAIYRNGKSNAR